MPWLLSGAVWTAFWATGAEKLGQPQAGIELGVGSEQRRAAADAVVGARLVVVPVLAGEGAFGGFLAGDFVLLGRQ